MTQRRRDDMTHKTPETSLARAESSEEAARARNQSMIKKSAQQKFGPRHVEVQRGRVGSASDQRRDARAVVISAEKRGGYSKKQSGAGVCGPRWRELRRAERDIGRMASKSGKWAVLC